MDKIIAGVDGAADTGSVCDLAIWAAQRLAAPLEFLHALDRHAERAPVADLSGSIGLGTQEALLQQLGELDERRSAVAQQHGRDLLDDAVRRARRAGVERVDARQRHGGFVEALLDLEGEARLVVLGRHRHVGAGGRLHLDHGVERAIRALQRPVLVAASRFEVPRRFAIAFDGSPTGRKIVETVARSPLLAGLRGDVVMAGERTPAALDALDRAREVLHAAGFDATAAFVAGDPQTALPAHVGAGGVDLLVIGAYGHSRIRHLIVGSTTTTLLRTSPVPVLVLR